MSFLELRGLTKRYDGVAAVLDFDLEVERGEFVSLLGPSGCGKTTTLQMIAGFVAPTEGMIVLDGRDITPIKPSQRGLGIVFQSYALFPHMTVVDNVAFGLEMRRVGKAERRQRVDEALALVHLEAFARALSARDVRRPAAAGRAGARTGDQAAGAAARRAAGRARRQAAPRHADRAARAAAPPRA